MNLQVLLILKQAETFNNSQSWKFNMTSWKHTPIFIRKNKYFFFFFFKFLSSKCPKLLLNALWSTNTCTGFHFTYSEYRKWIKRLFTVYGAQHSKRYQSEWQNRHFRESEDSVFFSKTEVISQMRETGFLFITVKLIKMALLPHQSLVSAVKLASKYPPPPHTHTQSPFSDRFQRMCTKMDLIFILWTFSAQIHF